MAAGDVVQFKSSVGAAEAPTLTLDSSPIEGNLLVAWLCGGGNLPRTIDGWTELTQQATGGGNSRWGGLHYKVAGAGESATITATGTGGYHFSVIEIEAPSATPLLVEASQLNASSTQQPTPAVTPGSGNFAIAVCGAMTRAELRSFSDQTVGGVTTDVFEQTDQAHPSATVSGSMYTRLYASTPSGTVAGDSTASGVAKTGIGAIAFFEVAAAGGGQTLDVGKVASGEAVRGVDLSAAGPDTLLLGKVASGEVVRGVDLSAAGPDTLSLGKIPSGEAVRGITLAGFTLTLDLGKIASGETVRGINVTAAGPLSLALGRIASSELLRGVTLSQSGPVTLLLGKVASGAAVRGLGLSQAGAAALSLGKIVSAAVVRGLGLSVDTEVVIYDVRPVEFDSGIEVVGFSSARLLVPFDSGVAVLQLGTDVRHAEYDSNVKAVSF